MAELSRPIRGAAGEGVQYDPDAGAPPERKERRRFTVPDHPSHPYYRPMDVQRAQRIVIFSVGGSVVIFAIAKASGTAPPKGTYFHAVLGGAVAGIMLATVAEFAPKLATGLGVLIFFGTLLQYGKPALSGVTKAEGAK